LIFGKRLTGKLVIYIFGILMIEIATTQIAISQLKRYHFAKQKMGSEFSITFFDDDSIRALKLANNAFLIVDTLNNSFSDYSPLSEISMMAHKAGNGEWIKVSDDLWKVLIESKFAFENSWGSFDITLGRLTKLWRLTKKEKKMPKTASLKDALLHSGFTFLELDTSNKKARISKKGVELDLGGIGKGYAAQKVLEYFYLQNIKSVLVDAAGNMAISEPPSDNLFWKIGLEHPLNINPLNSKLLNLKNCAISTSGDAYQFVEIGNKRYSHIINPKTGLGLGARKQVTVIADNAAKADWLSTAITILPLKKGILLAKKQKADFYIIENIKGVFKENKSENFKNYYLPN
jgi:FAD:protein FMN transferase